MNRTMLIAILVLAVGVMVLASGLAIAAPMGTAFTYQGRLILDGSAVTGEYDLQFKLYDSLSGGTQVGSTLDAPEVDVNEGYFTVLLDFGSAAFAGDARWLEIGVREGALEDPNTYDVFTPRQELTPAPYALYAASAPGGGGADSDWQISGTNMFSMPVGNVGIGTTTPSEKLDVNGQIRIRGGSPATGRVLTSNAAGVGTWQTPAADSDWNVVGSNMYSIPSGKVGIGTNSPQDFLDVNGRVRARHRDGTYAGFIVADQTGAFKGGFVLNGTIGPSIYALGQGYVVNVRNDNGNVGVGTTSPGDKLDVNGDIRVRGADIKDSGGTSRIALIDNGALYLKEDGGATRMTVATDGDIGIATTTPDAVLDVYGTRLISATSDGVVNIGSSGGTHVTLDNNELHARSGSGTANLYLNDFGGNVLIATASTGRLGVGTYTPGYRLELPNYASVNGRGRANAWVTYSSARWKKNIEPIEDPLDKVQSLRGVRFDWKEDGKADIGLVAEEVGQILPELVDYEDNGVDAKALDYGRLVALLIEAVKEQQSQITEQQGTITTQQAKIVELENALAQTQSLEQRLQAVEKTIQQQQLTVVKEVQQ